MSSVLVEYGPEGTGYAIAAWYEGGGSLYGGNSIQQLTGGSGPRRRGCTDGCWYSTGEVLWPTMFDEKELPSGGADGVQLSDFSFPDILRIF